MSSEEGRARCYLGVVGAREGCTTGVIRWVGFLRAFFTTVFLQITGTQVERSPPISATLSGHRGFYAPRETENTLTHTHANTNTMPFFTRFVPFVH